MSEYVQPKDFKTDPTRENKSGNSPEQGHAFQKFLVALRTAGIKTSIGEWLDFQKVLAADGVLSLDELYLVSKSLLVKNVVNYSTFDTVFGLFFYGIEPPSEVPVEEDQWRQEEEPVEDPIQKESEGIKEVVEATTLTSETVHGGSEATKDVKNSPNAADEGIQTDKLNSKGGGASGGFLSAREEVIKRKFEVYDGDATLQSTQVGRVLARLSTIFEDATDVQTDRLNVLGTIEGVSRNAGFPELVFIEELEEKAGLILLFDVGGTTDKFRPMMEKIFAGAINFLPKVQVYYFHNAIYGQVWPQKDGEYGKHFIPLQTILKKDPNHKIIIVGDAWMADFELPLETCQDFKRLRDRFPSTVWINPIPEREHDAWDNSGTIAEIKSIFPMYDLTLNGIEAAVQHLIEE